MLSEGKSGRRAWIPLLPTSRDRATKGAAPIIGSAHKGNDRIGQSLARPKLAATGAGRVRGRRSRWVSSEQAGRDTGAHGRLPAGSRCLAIVKGILPHHEASRRAAHAYAWMFN